MFTFEMSLLPSSYGQYFLYISQIHSHQTRSTENKLLYLSRYFLGIYYTWSKTYLR